MTKYPNSECEMHRDVKTDEPVCIVCMGYEIERLSILAEERRQALEWCRDNYPAVRGSDDVHFGGKTIEELATV